MSATLNERAMRLADQMASTAAALRIVVHYTAAGARVLDCGIDVPGGLEAGLAMARVCLAGHAEVSIAPGDAVGFSLPQVLVQSDAPVLACMASQYAGWQIRVEKFFGMGSGPMRAHYGKEALFEKIPGREQAPLAVGVIESRQLPSDAVIAYLCQQLQMPPNKLTVLVAPASSLAGTIQVVARSLETTLHKLSELGFDLNHVVSGFGSAPLPPVAADEIQAIGRTNDAILYGGRVVLWVRADEMQLSEIGPKVPSSASLDHGAPFAEIFKRYNHDFYKIDRMLFSPALVIFNNLTTGRCHIFGRLEPDVLRRSFLQAGTPR